MKRRQVLATLGIGSAAGAAAFAYRAAPSFWRQYYRDFSRPIGIAGKRPDASHWPDSGLHAAWLGHSTVLLKIDGFTLITDPVFSSRAGLSLGPLTLGVKRLTEAALSPGSLPKLDAVLISHAHMDHLDKPSLRALEGKSTEIVMAHATRDLIREPRYKKVSELRWGQRHRIGPATVQAIEVNHWGARMRSDTYRGYNGYIVEAGKYRVLFAGDTAATDAFRGVKSSRPFDLAIMPIGAYNPWIRYHCTPEQAWRMGNDAGADRFLPVHHKTFALSREPIGEPLDRFLAAAGSTPDRVVLHNIGEEFHSA